MLFSLLRFLLIGWGLCSLRGFGGDRRAVSPVFGTVIMVLIVVLGMSLVFAFFVDYVGDYQRGRGSSVMELMEIEDVYFSGVSRVEVWLYNFGEIEVEVDSVYVNGLPVTFSASGGSVVIVPSGHLKLTVFLSGDWVPDLSYVFRIVTERGSAVEREYFSPRVV
jgi:flagellin-like protein